jgi:tetratricopeptide (TPR) repeat protein
MGGRGWASAQQGLQGCQRYETTGNPADLARGIGLLQAGLAASSDPGEQALILGNLGTALWRHFELTGEGAVLDESIRARTLALSSGRLGPEDFVKWTHDLRDGLRARYDRSNRPADLDAAILVGRQVRELPPWFYPPAGLWVGWLTEYAADLEDRAQLRVPADGASADQAVLDDIETAVRLHREAISIAPAGYPDQPGLRSNLGNALTLRAVLAGPGQPEQAGQDLAEAVGLHREAVRLASATHPYIVRLHGNYCRALAEQAARTGDRELLDEAVTAARRAGERARPGEEASAARVLLVMCLAQRAKDAADPASLRELIDALEDPASPPVGPDEAAERRLAAADAWTEHYWVSGDPASLTRAVEHARAVLDSPGDIVRQDTVNQDTVNQDTVYQDTARFTLSTALRYRFEYVGDPADLAEATELARAALAAVAADDPGHRASCLGHLGVCLVLAAGPDAGRLAEGIGLIRQAISGWPAGDAAALSLRTDLAIALRSRYEETHDLADLDEAIELGRTVAAAPVRQADPARHGNDLARLGIAEQVRFRHTGQAADLDAAIEHGRAGSRLMPAGDPLWASYLSSLGLALQLRYDERGQAADLDEAVQAGDAAVAAIPDSDPHRWMALSNAGLAHRLRSELTGGEDDLQAAIELGRASVTAAGADQAALPGALNNLSRALFVRWQRHRDRADLSDAVAGFRAVARLAGAPRQGRLQAAISWAACATVVADWPAAADAYETAVDLLELIVWHGLPRAAREAQLAGLPGLASQAAASALAAGDPARALAVLDRGRSVLWTQQLRLRSSFDEVRDAAPELHQKLVQLAEELGRDPVAGDDSAGGDPAGSAGLAGLAGPAAGSARRDTGEHRQRLAAAWDETLDQVRARPGLAGTLRPPDAAELAGCGAHTPAVLLNVSEIRSDALLLTGQGVTVLALPGVTPDAVRQQAGAHLGALQALAQGPEPDPPGYLAAEPAIRAGLDWLRTEITGPVLDELDRLGALPASAAGAARHVRWCPAGLLSLLPLHAAAHDRVISSYTPTVRALLAASRQPEQASDGPILVVAVPRPATAPGQPGQPGLPELPELPGVRTEARQVCARFGGRHTLRSDRAATREQILADLPGHPLAHFACHGQPDLHQPSEAALRLWDSPLTVVDVAGLRLAGELAFLSACDTAAGSVTLPDEAIHLAAAVQAAGYRHVVATLWQIGDDVAPSLTETVYGRLAPDGRLDGGQAASALHAAVGELRARFPDRPSRWACYAHFGP